MKILDDGTRVPESAEERRRLRQMAQDWFDEAEYQRITLPDRLDQVRTDDGHFSFTKALAWCQASRHGRPGDVEPIGILSFHALDWPIPFVGEHGPGAITGYSSCVVYDPDDSPQAP